MLTRSHYLWKHEPCFMGWVRPNRPPKVADETLASTWELPSFHRDDRPDHPTPKPLDCFGIPMRQHVARGGLCYEPFSGSGSQIMAGEANGRRVYAMEISPAYVDVAVERWQAETGRAAVLDGDGRSFAEVREERIGATPRRGGRRVKQIRLMSLVEAVANVVVGYGIAVLTQLVVFPGSGCRRGSAMRLRSAPCSLWSPGQGIRAPAAVRGDPDPGRPSMRTAH